MNKLALLLGVGLSLSSFAGGDKGRWAGMNDPMRIDKNFVTKLSDLPRVGDITGRGLGWPGYYWSNAKAGISRRWQTKIKKDKEAFKYTTLSLWQLKHAGKANLSKLSPAEKYDILMGNYSYPTVEKVREATKGSKASWTGICHGVSPAGLHHPEPKAKSLVNPDGIEIEFYSSDIKALLAFYYAKISDNKSTQVGKRCSRKRGLNLSDECRDINPGALHVIMANRLSSTGHGFIADLDRKKEVWNHVAVKFSSKFSNKRFDEKKGAFLIDVKTSVDYTGFVYPSKAAILGTKKEKWDTRKYEYTLELVNANIVGGEWISKERPDFIWDLDVENFDDDYYGAIESLL